MFVFPEISLPPLPSFPPSRRFFFYCIAFIIGIGLGSFVPFFVSLTLAWVAFLAFVIFRGRSLLLSIVLLCLVSGSIGAAWFAYRIPSADWWPSLSGRQIVFSGHVVHSPTLHRKTQTVSLSVSSIDNISVPKALPLRLSLPLRPPLQEGDNVWLRGELTVTQHGRTRKLTAKHSILTSVASGHTWQPMLSSVVTRLVASTRQVFPAPASDFVAGLLVGGKTTLDNYWKNLLSATGTTHLVALSGFNVTIMMSAILAALAALGVPRKTELWMVLGFLFLFVMAVGASASLIRAVVMGVVALYGRTLGRAAATMNALLFAAVVMLVFTPTLLKDDLGFQLSFLATLGLLTIYPHLDGWLYRWPNPLGFKEALLMATSAEIMVTPWLLFTFGHLSVISPLVNMLVVPPIPAIMLFGFLGSVGGLINTQLGQVLGFGAYVGASAVLGIIQWAARLPWASVQFSISPVFIIMYYAVVIGWLQRLQHKFKKTGVAI